MTRSSLPRRDEGAEEARVNKSLVDFIETMEAVYPNGQQRVVVVGSSPLVTASTSSINHSLP